MPILNLNPFMVLAQTRIEAMNEVLPVRESVEGWNTTALVASIVAGLLLCAGIFVIRKMRTRLTKSDSKLLFSELCRVHHLSGKQRRLLSEIGRTNKVDDLSLLMLNAELWKLDPASAQSLCAPNVQIQILKLQHLLFAPAKLTA